MWSLLPRRYQVLIVAGSGIITAWAIDGAYAWYAGHPAGPLKFVSLAATIVATLLVAIANFTWRPLWRKIPGLAKKTFPDLNGTWKGHLLSTWADPATGQQIPPIATTIDIKQGLFST